jgi:hypothetical protein
MRRRNTRDHEHIRSPNDSQVQQSFPIILSSGSDSVPFTTIGGNNNTYPQGRKVTQWQVNDNLTWTHGKHTWKVGINTGRLDVSNYDLGEGTVRLAFQRAKPALHRQRQWRLSGKWSEHCPVQRACLRQPGAWRTRI